MIFLSANCAAFIRMGNEQSQPIPDATITQHDDSSPHDSDSVEVTDEEADDVIEPTHTKRQKLTEENLKHIPQGDTYQVVKHKMARLNTGAGGLMPPPSQSQKLDQRAKSAATAISDTPAQTKTTNTSQRVDVSSSSKKRRKRKSRSARESRNSTSGSIHAALDRSDEASRRSSVIRSDSIDEPDVPAADPSRASLADDHTFLHKLKSQSRRHRTDLHRILSPEEQKIFEKEPELFGVYATSDESGDDAPRSQDKQSGLTKGKFRSTYPVENNSAAASQPPGDVSASESESDVHAVEVPIPPPPHGLVTAAGTRDVHPLENGRWPCPFATQLGCTTTFRERKGAMRHADNHTNPDKYQCQKCNRGFSRKDKYDVHSRKCQSTTALQTTLNKASKPSSETSNAKLQTKPGIDTSYPVSVAQASPAKRRITDSAGRSHTISKDMDLGEASTRTDDELAGGLQDGNDARDENNEIDDISGELHGSEDVTQDTNTSQEASLKQDEDLAEVVQDNGAILPSSHQKLRKFPRQDTEPISNESDTPEVLRGVDFRSNVHMSRSLVQTSASSRLKRKRLQADDVVTIHLIDPSRKRTRRFEAPASSIEDVDPQSEVHEHEQVTDHGTEAPKVPMSKKKPKKSRYKLTRKELASNTTLNGFVQRRTPERSDSASDRPESSMPRASSSLVSVDIPKVTFGQGKTGDETHARTSSRKGKERAHSVGISVVGHEQDEADSERGNTEIIDDDDDDNNIEDPSPLLQSASKLKMRRHRIRSLRTRTSDTSSGDEKPSRKPRSKSSATPRAEDTNIVTGRFSDREVAVLENWRLNFCEDYGMSKAKFNDMITQAAKRERDVVWPYKGIERRELLQEFRAQLPHRSRKSMQRFRERYFQNANVEPWTAEDDEELRDLVKKIGTKWTEISEMMNRTRDACHSRWKFQLNYGRKIHHGDWSVKETKRLQEEVQAAAELKGVDPEDQAADLPWSAIAEKVGSRSAQQCSNKWRILHRQRGQDNKFVKVPFADRIGETGLGGERTPGKTRKRLIKSEEIIVDSSDEDEQTEPLPVQKSRASVEEDSSGDQSTNDTHKSRGDNRSQRESDVNMLNSSDGESVSQPSSEEEQPVSPPMPTRSAYKKEGTISSSQPTESKAKRMALGSSGVESSSQPQPTTASLDSHNPLQSNTRTPAKGLSLTQLLDGTQANTTAKKASQFDKSRGQSEERPSPVVNLARAQMSSPMKPIESTEHSGSDDDDTDSSSGGQADPSSESSDTDEEAVSLTPAVLAEQGTAAARPDIVIPSQTIPRTELRKPAQLRKTYAKSPRLKQGISNDSTDSSSQVVPQTTVVDGFKDIETLVHQPQSFSARLQAAAEQSNEVESESSEETISESESKSKSESESKSESRSESQSKSNSETDSDSTSGSNSGSSSNTNEEDKQDERADKEKQKQGFFRSILNIWPGSSSQKTAGTSQSSPVAKRRRLEDVLVSDRSRNHLDAEVDLEESSDEDDL